MGDTAMTLDAIGNEFHYPGCPECGAPLEFTGVCALCRACGYSPCG